MERLIHAVSTPNSAPGSRLLLALLLGLGGCQTTPPVPPPPPPQGAGTPAEGAFAIPRGARELVVNAEKSLLQILVFRGGAMARLGHNHIVASHQLTGSVYLTDDPLATRFDIRFPVNELTVDEPALREAAGPDFTASVPQSARDGTRANLLSPALLDGSNYPTIRLRALDIRQDGEGFDAGVEVILKGSVHLLRVPVQVQRSEGAVVATGEFPLLQSQLGLQPFSVAMGTLVVLDEMKVRFEIRAGE
jgi:polyisoprenoid-binding protein YceI